MNKTVEEINKEYLQYVEQKRKTKFEAIERIEELRREANLKVAEMEKKRLIAEVKRLKEEKIRKQIKELDEAL